MSQKKYLIAGLGNMEGRYKNTRHNIGFEVVEHIAAKHQAQFSQKPKVKGLVGSYSTEKSKVYLLMPLTYMNESGVSVSLAVQFYQIPLANILIIVDDVAIDLGQFRLRTESGTGGHNGLKSIKEHLKTNDYARLRVGVGRGKGDLSDYVLGKFTSKENEILPEVIKKASGYAETFINEGLTEAMNEANMRAKKPINEETVNDK